MTPKIWADLLFVVLAATACLAVGYVSYKNWRRFRTPPTIIETEYRTSVEHGIKLGNDIHIANVDAPHGTIVLVGWHADWWKWKPGDAFIIFTQGSKHSTRYRINEISGRNVDHYFWARCTFAPRGDR